MQSYGNKGIKTNNSTNSNNNNSNSNSKSNNTTIFDTHNPLLRRDALNILSQMISPPKSYNGVLQTYTGRASVSAQVCIGSGCSNNSESNSRGTWTPC